MSEYGAALEIMQQRIGALYLHTVDIEQENAHLRAQVEKLEDINEELRERLKHIGDAADVLGEESKDVSGN